MNRWVGAFLTHRFNGGTVQKPAFFSNILPKLTTLGGKSLDEKNLRNLNNMTIRQLVKKWFEVWENGDFQNIPVTENFKHTSPFGTIDGKKAYLELVESNRDKFLGYRFEIHDEIFGEDNACVRYTGIQGDFKLDVSEWIYAGKNGIKEIVSYYHIGEIKEDRQIEDY